MREETEKKLDEFEDKKKLIYLSENYLLNNVFDASRDLINGFHDDEFADSCGGINKLVHDHEVAVNELQEWIDD
ncbi:MAG: hypothetical protein KGY67_00690 [Candidatus Thermoplasmatota archaeon]|nr:hypothetical protein [Candidatus Thermoplasmatota archaeon]